MTTTFRTSRRFVAVFVLSGALILNACTKKAAETPAGLDINAQASPLAEPVKTAAVSPSPAPSPKPQSFMSMFFSAPIGKEKFEYAIVLPNGTAYLESEGPKQSSITYRFKLSVGAVTAMDDEFLKQKFFDIGNYLDPLLASADIHVNPFRVFWAYGKRCQNVEGYNIPERVLSIQDGVQKILLANAHSLEVIPLATQEAEIAKVRIDPNTSAGVRECLTKRLTAELMRW